MAAENPGEEVDFESAVFWLNGYLAGTLDKALKSAAEYARLDRILILNQQLTTGGFMSPIHAMEFCTLLEEQKAAVSSRIDLVTFRPITPA